MEAFTSVPLIDLKPLLSGTKEDQSKVAKEIEDACTHVGFFYACNHGIEDELVEQVQSEMRKFFDLPNEEKQKIATKLSKCHRGYFGLGEENLEENGSYDLKEGFDFGINIDDPESNPKLKGIPNYGPNSWPSKELVPTFQSTLQKYFDRVFELGINILRGFAIALNLPPDYFNRFYKGEVPAMPILRLLRYPPLPKDAPKNVLSCGAHSDYGFITILYQDDVGGLELQNSEGAWIKAPPIKGSLVVNIGDMMARLSNSIYSATRHRVMNYSGKERFSIPFFFDPEFYTTVEPLDSCVSESRPKKFPVPLVYGQHLMKILDSTWVYRQKD